MNLFFLLVVLFFLTPIFRLISYISPSLTSILYIGLLIYVVYMNYKRSKMVYVNGFDGRNKNASSTEYKTKQTKTTSEEIKKDVIDVEFTQRDA